jgi:hypothetical protein
MLGETPTRLLGSADAARKESPMRTDSPTTLDDRRRARGLTIAQLARLTTIPYQRVWLAATGGHPLTDDEATRVEAALLDHEPDRRS